MIYYRKLVSMLDYVLEINSLSDKEFFKKYCTDDIFDIRILKQKITYNYAKLLSFNLTEDMFIGEDRIFNLDNEMQVNRGVISAIMYKDIVIYINNESNNNKKVKDLTELNLTFKEIIS